MNDCTFIIFGASGDLFKRKLFPSLYALIVQKKVSNFALIGAAFDETDMKTLIEHSREFIKEDIDEKIWQQINNCAYYQQLDFNNKDSYLSFKVRIEAIEKKQKLSGNRMFYLAAAADFFCIITECLAISGVAQKKNTQEAPWHRLVYEKPFGHDLASAQAINSCIKKYFNEVQIYRIDHYLTKEIVGNIALVRFTNCVFEPLWNNRYIDNVQIVLSESIGIENRGAYYDRYGAVCDVVQNHMLELIALIAMEAPQMLTGEYVREQRAQVLKKVSVVDGIYGQYDGYLQEAHVNSQSMTETFAAIMLHINNHRWSGVPFYLKTGKYLKKKETHITIKFKQVDCLLKVCPRDSNYLTISIDPESGFSLTLNVKKPGIAQEVMPVNMDFCHSCLFESFPPEAYEVLLDDIIRGEHSVSVRFDEIEDTWTVVDEIRRKQFSLYTYQKEADGPKELEDFNKKHGVRWLL